MKINVGTVDRWLRIVVGLGILSLVFWGPRSLWALIGLVPLATGIIRVCPGYWPFGISTCGRGSTNTPQE